MKFLAACLMPPVLTALLPSEAFSKNRPPPDSALSGEATDILSAYLGRFPSPETPPFASKWLSDWTEVLLGGIAGSKSFGGPTYGSRLLFLHHELIFNAWKWGISHQDDVVLPPDGIPQQVNKQSLTATETVDPPAAALPFHLVAVEVAAYLSLLRILDTRGIRDEPAYAESAKRLETVRTAHADEARKGGDLRLAQILEALSSDFGIPPADSETDNNNVNEAANSTDQLGLLLQLRGLSEDIDTWLEDRDADGWWDAHVMSGDWPNANATVIYNQNLSVSQDLKEEIPDEKLWTPLEMEVGNGGRVWQKFLTPEWRRVKGVLDDETSEKILKEGQAFFPSSFAQMQAEMLQVVALSHNLTSEQKASAEFWSGSPGTVAPPGFMSIFLIMMIEATPSLSLNMDAQVLLFSLVSRAVFEAGRHAWTLKRQNMQARPIAVVRSLLNDVRILSWQKEAETFKIIDGQQWVPYQSSDSINGPTPPFPDFISGHSCFSAAACQVLARMLKNGSLVQPGSARSISRSDLLPLMSHLFRKGHTPDNVTLGEVTILPGSSTIEASEPPVAVTLQWPTFEEMKDAAGMSRLYGGIHPMSSNLGGKHVGNLIGDALIETLKNDAAVSPAGPGAAVDAETPLQEAQPLIHEGTKAVSPPHPSGESLKKEAITPHNRDSPVSPAALSAQAPETRNPVSDPQAALRGLYRSSPSSSSSNDLPGDTVAIVLSVTFPTLFVVLCFIYILCLCCIEQQQEQ